MAGRIPVGSHRADVAKEMEAIFVQNLNYAADILSKVDDLFCPTYHSNQLCSTKWIETVQLLQQAEIYLLYYYVTAARNRSKVK